MGAPTGCEHPAGHHLASRSGSAESPDAASTSADLLPISSLFPLLLALRTSGGLVWISVTRDWRSYAGLTEGQQRSATPC